MTSPNQPPPFQTVAPLLVLKCGEKYSFGTYSHMAHRYVVGDTSLNHTEVTGWRYATEAETAKYFGVKQITETKQIELYAE